MNDIQIFNNPEFGEIRTIDQNGEPWFVGKDVALALGYGEGKSLANAVSNHVDDADKGVTEMMTPGGMQKMTIINESGLYSLCFSSKLEGAVKFKRWVTSEVLPQIRKTGSYMLPKMTKEMQAIFLLDNRTAQLDQRVTALENNAVIDYGQQQTLKNAVNRRVVTEVLGGKDSPAYEDAHVRGMVYCELNKDLQNWFRVSARNNIPRKRFDEAIEYVNRWKPSTNTAMMIQNVNGQTKMFA